MVDLRIVKSSDLDTHSPELPPPNAPLAVARHLLKKHTHSTDGLTLRNYRGGWVRWTGAHWADVEDREIRADLYRLVEKATYYDEKASEAKPWNPTARRISDLADAMGAATHLPEDVDAPVWLRSASNDPPAREIVACTNGLLHVSSRRLLDPTPRFFTRVSVPFGYAAQPAEPQQWLRFLAQLWPNDPDAIATLQEWFGYVVSGRTDLHKILLIVGPTRSGKGTIARILTEMVGSGNVAGPTLASLGTNFGLSPLLGKSLAIVADARMGGRDTFATVERLLSISGEDRLTIDRKFRQPWTGRLPVRFMVASNELPKFGDASGAIVNRFLVLTMTRSFLGHEDHHLTDRLLPELPGILRWALDGLARLVERGSFTVPQSSDDAIAGLLEMSSPVESFLRDETAGDGEVAVSDLFAAWKRWCQDNGRDHPGTAATFGRDLRSCRPTIKSGQRTGVNGKRYRIFAGIHLDNTRSSKSRVQPRAAATETAAANPPARDNTRANPMQAQQEHHTGNACQNCQAEIPRSHALCQKCKHELTNSTKETI